MFKWLRKNERGSVMVIVALSMVVLLGFTGLAVDYGGMAAAKSELQNAADAAALAAGQDRASGLSPESAIITANKLIAANGYPNVNLDGVTISNVEFGSNTVTVTVSTQYDVAFTTLLTGHSTETVTAKAVVSISNGFSDLPYAIFAGMHFDDGNADGVDLNGNKMVVNGNVHSNSYISIHKKTQVNGEITAAKPFTYGGKTYDESIVVQMPSAKALSDLAKTGYIHTGNVDEKNFDDFLALVLEHTSPGPTGLNIYVTGDLRIKGDDFYNKDYPVNLVVHGDVKLGGCGIRSTATTPVNVISETGNIEVCGRGTRGECFYGIIFAENGDVTLNGGNDDHYAGSIYGQNIYKNGSGLTVSYNSQVDDHFPKGKVRLIE